MNFFIMSLSIEFKKQISKNKTNEIHKDSIQNFEKYYGEKLKMTKIKQRKLCS